ncbi:hypothetical protein GJ744_002685 [Endocarpon pusillum]|uniref:F-box domain-containing protein n=1 Tax=Endocarpon pusillum TaxID=364733 RepID=A0A8H7E2H5_9EURO|nr:hypothetical protein GJ744_002685 [Endocarpon pusillum]
MAQGELESLPDEILRSVCFFLDWHDAISLQSTNRRFRDVANEHLLWKYYCQCSFRYWAVSHHIFSKLADPSFVQWKQLFKYHHEAEIRTISALQGVISSQRARTPKIESIVELGYDAKDALLQSHARASESDDHLARRYWSHVALGCLHRSLAVQEWAALKDGEQQDGSFEKSVGALDLFILDDAREGDIDDIFQRLDDYIDAIRRAHPDIEGQSPQQKAVTTAEYLISNNLVAIPEDREYHNIEHNFLGRALFSQEKNSLPIISVIIYCYVVRQLGLSAAPCGFPLHVHAVVYPPPGVDLEGNDLPSGADRPALYMDPFRSSNPVPVSFLHEQLNFLARQLTSTDHNVFLSASTPRDITIRCARNIVNSLQQSTEPSSGRPIDLVSAHYAALWALILLNTSITPLRHRQHLLLLMHLFLEKFPHDASLVEKHILPLIENPSLSDHAQMCHSVRKADMDAPGRVKPRLGNADVKFKVGQVFRHKRYGYVAVVTGWDGTCDADEEWILRMGVDRLDGGRRQAFYNAFVQEDKSMRYVAGENIEPLPAHEVVPEAFPLEIGKWFKRWDDIKKVFVSNVRDEYPDD